MDERLTLKKLSASYEVIPSSMVWDGINEQLDALDKKRRRGIVWFFLFGVIATGLASLLIIRPWGGNENAEHNSDPEKNIPAVTQSIDNSNSSEQATTDENKKVAVNETKNSVNENLAHIQKTTDIAKNRNQNKSKINVVDAEKKSVSSPDLPAKAIIKFEEEQSDKSDLSSEVKGFENVPSKLNEEGTRGFMKPIYLASIGPVIVEQEFKPMPDTADNKIESSEKTTSRWSIRAIAGPDFINHDRTKSKDENLIEDRNFTSISLSAGMTYDVCPGLKIFSGLNYRKTGMISERSEIRKVVQTGSWNTGVAYTGNYDIPTSAGTLTGTAFEFERIYFNSPDSSLFPPFVATSAAGGNDSVTVRDLTLRSEFEFISMPVQLIYYFSGSKLSPYIAGGFSAGYMISDFRKLNGTSFPYEYKEKLNKWAIICCVLVFPLAFIAGPIRGIPFFHQLIDCSFGLIGIIPLSIVLKKIRQLEKSTGQLQTS